MASSQAQGGGLGSFRWDIRKRLSNQSKGVQWNSPPRQLDMAPSLFQERLDNAHSDMDRLQAVLWAAGSWSLCSLWIPSKSAYSMIWNVLHFVWELCCCYYIVRAQAASSCEVEECLCGIRYSSNYMISISIFLLPLCYTSLELDLSFFLDNFSNEWWHRWCKWCNSVHFNLVPSAYRPQAYCGPVTSPPFWSLVDVDILSSVYK